MPNSSLDGGGKQRAVDLAHAFDMGYDCGINGANAVNCDFRIFSAPEFTKAWESGKKLADEHKARKPLWPRP